MKKIFIAAALLFAGISTAFAGNDRPITLDKLPAAAQTFLKSHFAELTLAYAVEDPKFIGSEYEVIYTDRTEVEFDSDGAWTSVGSRYAAVPADIVPEQIKSYVAQTFPNQQVRKIERKREFETVEEVFYDLTAVNFGIRRVKDDELARIRRNEPVGFTVETESEIYACFSAEVDLSLYHISRKVYAETRFKHEIYIKAQSAEYLRHYIAGDVDRDLSVSYLYR